MKDVSFPFVFKSLRSSLEAGSSRHEGGSKADTMSVGALRTTTPGTSSGRNDSRCLPHKGERRNMSARGESGLRLPRARTFVVRWGGARPVPRSRRVVRPTARQTDEQEDRGAPTSASPVRSSENGADWHDKGGEAVDGSFETTTREGEERPAEAEVVEDHGLFGATFEGLSTKWAELPYRYKIVTSMALAFVVCNMDKVNISIAIIPMASDFGWKPTTAGFIQSAFFYGYLVAQLPGGWLSNKFGGQKVLPFGVALWSIATAVVPLVAGDIRALSISRVAVGLGEGLSPPAAADVIARYVPVNERSRATSFVFGGLNMGTIAGLTVAPTLIESFGWPSVFVGFGVIGIAWCAWFDAVVPKNAILPESDEAKPALGDPEDKVQEEEEEEEEEGGIPWGEFVRHRPLRALTYIHFCNNWAIYTILSWLPTFYKDSLNVGLQGAAHLALLPPMAGLAVSVVAAPLADGLIERGVSITLVRKLMQSVAFLSPAACMLACIVSEDRELSTWLLPLGLGLQTFSFAGLYSNHQDISPKYASILLAITNIFGSMPGVVGVPFTGWLLDHTDSWTISLFAPSLFFYTTGVLVYTKYGSGERLVLERDKVKAE